MMSNQQHWDAIFADTDTCTLGWYEQDASQSMKLLHLIPNLNKSTFFIAGAGTTVLIDELLKLDGTIIINDISTKAIEAVKQRVAKTQKTFYWLCQNIALPIKVDLPQVDVWIDRAVLHFLTQDDEIDGYSENLKRHLKIGGYAFFAEFSKTGATECTGLPIRQYSSDTLSSMLGDDFSLIETFEHNYINPNGGSRPYIYALYQWIK